MGEAENAPHRTGCDEALDRITFQRQTLDAMSELSDRLLDLGIEESLVMDGYDDCMMGVWELFGMEPIVMYDKEKVIEKIMEESTGGSYEDALEYYEFNQLGGWHGDKTPGFLVRLPS